MDVGMSRRDLLVAALGRVHDLLDRHGIWHCLAYGTLLGAVRDGDLIEWDHDIDLLVRPADQTTLLRLHELEPRARVRFSAVCSAGWRLALNPARVPWFSPGYLFIYVDEVLVGEAYAPVLFDDGVLRLYDLATEVIFWPQTSFPHHLVEELAQAPVRDHQYPVPARAAQLLEFTYGPGWRTPRRSAFDGGDPDDRFGTSGDLLVPNLAEQVCWCEATGWDRTRYAGQPRWPRRLNGAGPVGPVPRTAATSRSTWWHTLDELVAHH
jgi:hypothetical protein